MRSNISYKTDESYELILHLLAKTYGSYNWLKEMGSYMKGKICLLEEKAKNNKYVALVINKVETLEDKNNKRIITLLKNLENILGPVL